VKLVSDLSVMIIDYKCSEDILEGPDWDSVIK